MGPHIFNFQLQLGLRPFGCALEGHVLEEVCHAIVGGILIPEIYVVRTKMAKGRTNLDPVSIQRPTVAVGAPLSSLATLMPLSSTVT